MQYWIEKDKWVSGFATRVAPNITNNSRLRGFTLFEILIVLVIIAIMSGVAVLSVSGANYPRFTSEANKISNLLELISDQAVYTNSVIQCEAATYGITCQAYRSGEWTDLNLSRIVSWQWPNKIRIQRVIVNGMPLKDGQQLQFLPNGGNDAISIQITNGVYSTWIDNDLNDNFRISN
jgi:prepilin-type N-terminal cleavage/methylation domain-containing protein